MAGPFISRSLTDNTWFSAGLATSFADIPLPTSVLSDPLPCSSDGSASPKPGCKIFHIPSDNTSQAAELSPSLLSEDIGAAASSASRDLRHQILVFQYKGVFHAMDNLCPHSSFPLSNASTFDIEDFGIVFSAGITCPKHGWSFDVFSGQSDRGPYRLKLWEVEVRGEGDGREVWIRKRQRIG